MAVLPTPGSPTSTGLFLVRRREHLHHALGLALAADDRVELLLAGELGEVATELVEHQRARRGVRRRAAAGRWSSRRPDRCWPDRWAGVAGEQLDDLLADPGEVGAELDEHLGGDALALTDQAEQDVLGADVVVAELERLAERQLEDLLGPRREGDVAGRRRAALADDLLDLLAHGLEGDAERLERLRGDALALVDQPEQDVLGPDVVVIEEASLLLGQHDDPAGPVGEAFEHVSCLLGDSLDQCNAGGGVPGNCVRLGDPVPLGCAQSRITQTHCRPRHGPIDSRSVTSHVRGRHPSLGRSRQTAGILRPWPEPNPLQVMPSMDRRPRPRRARAARRRSTRPIRYLTEIATHLIRAGGKRVRPGFCHRRRPPPRCRSTTAGVRRRSIRGGVAVELVHLGSLYHDDVMDDAIVRRTVDSVNARWGNHRAILAGDFLLARASELAASLGVEVAGLLGRHDRAPVRGPDCSSCSTRFDRRTARRATCTRSTARPPRCSGTACRIGGIVADLPRDHIDARDRRSATATAWPSRSSTTSSTWCPTRTSWASRPVTTSRRACTRCR